MARRDDAPIEDHLLHEVKLASNHREREQYDNLANVFAIVQTLEQLERAYSRDSVTGDEYSPECNKLIRQYKAAIGLVPSSVSENMDQFFKDYRLRCPAAKHRLKAGVSATDEYGGAGKRDKSESRVVLKVTASFITVMDALSMEQRAVDQLHPNLADLNNNLNQVTFLNSDFQGKVTIRKWMEILHGMKASDELSEEQARQLLFDLETSMNAFEQAL